MARTLREVSFSVLMAVALFVSIESVTARNYVDGPSMEPNLHKGQVLLVSRLGISGLTRQVFAGAHLDEPSATDGWVPPRGSIATFRHPIEPEKLLVKRVVGLPGEQIAIRNGVVYVDGTRLDEPYVEFHDNRNMTSTRVPLDSIFVLGDNRPSSSDSRVFGPVPRSNLLGVAVLRYWPPTAVRLMLGTP